MDTEDGRWVEFGWWPGVFRGAWGCAFSEKRNGFDTLYQLALAIRDCRELQNFTLMTSSDLLDISSAGVITRAIGAVWKDAGYCTSAEFFIFQIVRTSSSGVIVTSCSRSSFEAIPTVVIGAQCDRYFVARWHLTNLRRRLVWMRDRIFSSAAGRIANCK